MAERLRKFINRSPRYVLRPQDRNVMRFSLEHTQGGGGVEETLLLNLSETGVAFLVDSGYEPRVGEKIKVEVPIPGGNQIAWWAKVVRTSEYNGSRRWFSPEKDTFDVSNKVIVALRFDEMPEAHTSAIRQGLKQSFAKALDDQQFRDWLYNRQEQLVFAGKVFLFGLLFALVVGFVYWFSLPDETYDAKRGSPWGERFKF